MSAAVMLCVLTAPACVSAELKLRDQFRSDLESMLLASAEKPLSKAVDIAKMIEEGVAAAEQQAPGIFIATPAPRVPTDEVLRATLAEVVATRGEIPPASVLSFYLERWKDQRLLPAQKILFYRGMRALIDRTKEERHERERKRSRG